jgi:hypothetical protein
MALARSKVTAQGQISIPAAIRRSARFSSEDIHRAVFPTGPPKAKTVDQMKEGIRRHARERYARH